MTELLFHGAAGEVTGSMHLVQTNGEWIALDCGLFQGRRADSEAKNHSWPLPPSEISALVLSHAHIDHTGRLPKLVADGFRGPIYCTPATRDLSAVMLMDSAHIQQEDAEFVNRKRARRDLPPIKPLYTYDDVVAAVKQMQTVSYDRDFTVRDLATARFIDAGHMLGSAGISLQPKNGGPTLFFTGDVGRHDTPILRDPVLPPPADVVISESTYGGRVNPQVQAAKDVLVDVVRRTFARGGQVIIPAFSVGRTQTICYFLQQVFDSGVVPSRPIYVDSPLAVSATEVFKMHPCCYDREARDLQSQAGGIFGGRYVQYIREADSSRKLNSMTDSCIIISASGMCESGRILHHLRHHAGRKQNTILLPGYQAANTLGRRISEGVREVTIFHEPVRIEAEVVQLDGFSGHADQAELIAHLQPLANGHARAFLVHGEPEQAAALQAKISGLGFSQVQVAQRGQRVQL